MYILGEIALILVLAFVLSKIINKFYRKIDKKKNTKSVYSLFINSIKAPLKIFIWVLAASYIVVLTNKFLNFDILDSILLVRKIAFISLLGLFLFKIIHEYELYSKKNE